MSESLYETTTREEAMAWVEQRARDNGGWIGREDLLTGFTPSMGSGVMPLIDTSRGIRNPASLNATLSVTMSVGGPYQDVDTGDGLVHYAYRKGGMGGDNTKLRRAIEMRVPLILFIKTEPNVLVPVFPVYVVADDSASQTFVIALDEVFTEVPDASNLSENQRRYAQRMAKQRLHQPVFRGQILKAYAGRCSVCRLGHVRLLEAAHIYPDGHPDGHAVVSNGIALCSIHHTAYDANMMGITADYVVKIRGELLVEIDGPMLKHGIQEMDGRRLTLPTRRSQAPDKEALAYRYEHFTAS